VVRDIPENGVAVAEEMKRRNLDFTNLAAVERTVVDLISVGKLYLNPAAISAEFEQRYSDERYGAYQMSRVSAADLAVFTSRFVPKKQDESKLSADQYWHAHPELSEERYRPHRAAGDAESLRRAKAEVERFLASKIGLQYEKDRANRDVLLQYLSDNGLTLSVENLATAFDVCTSKLKLLSQKIQQYNGTAVVDFGESVQNPSKITSELKETISRSLATTAANIRIGWFAIPKKLPCWMNNN
jgi:hypothetical protein